MVRRAPSELAGYALVGWMMTGILGVVAQFGVDHRGLLVAGGLVGAAIGGFAELSGSLVAKLLWLPMAVVVAGLEALGYLVW